jgi:hypothetical protein
MNRCAGETGVNEVAVETNERIAPGAKLLLGVAICSLALVASHGGGFAQSPQDTAGIERRSISIKPTPTPVASLTLLMEGTGQIAQSPNPCTSQSCSGTFTATMSGRPFGKADLTLNLSVNPTADAFTGCNQVTGAGGINHNAYTVNLIGQLCAPGVGYLLSGSVQIFAPTAAVGTAASGTLVAFGGTNIPPNPVPNSGPSLVSIIGASGKIPLFIP